MSDPLMNISAKQTPQGQPVLGRDDQVENSAGGYVFATDPWQQLDRFLILGTWSNTLYATREEITLDNAKNLFALVADDPRRVVDRAVEISDAGRAPRNNPALFSIAVVAGKADKAVDRSYALEHMPRVARTATHLFIFINYVQQMRGWGRSLRRGITNWYTSRSAESVAHQLVKYRQREGWTHRDVLLKAHVTPFDESMATAFKFAAGKVTEPTNDERLVTIDAFLEAQTLGDNDTKRAIQLINDGGLPWEALPDGVLNSPEVWEALLPKMGQTALIRQLPKLTRIGLLKPLSNTSKEVANMIANQERLSRGRIHPVSVLNALMTYSSGHSIQGKATWQPVSDITDALDAAFYLSFRSVEPAGVRTLNALDVSSSMFQNVVGSPVLTARLASCAMAMVNLAVEPMTHTVAFTGGGLGWGRAQNTDNISTFNISAKERLDDVVKRADALPFGGTDCALPMLWAMKNEVEVDAFHIYTDNETWAGDIHPFEAVRKYREKMNINAKVIVYGLSTTNFTIADPRDPGMLDVVGLDSAAPQLAADFAGGRL